MERAKEVLGFHERTTLEEGIRRTVEWFLSNMKLVQEARGARP
jgi:nucleoside-diphosphate-sugar epimerase